MNFLFYNYLDLLLELSKDILGVAGTECVVNLVVVLNSFGVAGTETEAELIWPGADCVLLLGVSATLFLGIWFSSFLFCDVLLAVTAEGNDSSSDKIRRSSSSITSSSELVEPLVSRERDEIGEQIGKDLLVLDERSCTGGAGGAGFGGGKLFSLLEGEFSEDSEFGRLIFFPGFCKSF